MVQHARFEQASSGSSVQPPNHFTLGENLIKEGAGKGKYLSIGTVC